MMATKIIEIDAAWAEKWTKTRVQFLSAPTVYTSKVLCVFCQNVFLQSRHPKTNVGESAEWFSESGGFWLDMVFFSYFCLKH